MKLVKEHISFERGIDPKDAMATGDPIGRTCTKLQNSMIELAEKYNFKIEFKDSKHEFYSCIRHKDNQFVIKYYKPSDDIFIIILKPFQVSAGVRPDRNDKRIMHHVYLENAASALKTLEKYIKQYLKNKKENERI